MTGLAGFLTLRDAAILRAPPEPGLELCHSLSDALDAVLAAAFPAEPAVALLALGGYGRRELCLFSDIDLMLLYEGTPPVKVIDAVLYPLWDAGLKVGHAVRTVPEAVRAADESLETLTSLLDLRLVAGARSQTDRLSHELARLLARSGGRMQAKLRGAEEARRQAEPYQLLEADLKAGRGGLRSLHGRHWVCRALVLGGAADTEPEALGPEHDILLRSRNALHAAAGKARDTWVFDLQPQACVWLGSDVDAWGRQLYGSLRAVDRAVAAAWEANGDAQPSAGPGRIMRGILAARRDRVGGSQPTAAMETAPAPRPGQSIFDYAGRLAAAGSGRLPAQAARVIRAAAGPSWNAADRAGLLSLLKSGQHGREMFEALADLDWLERALPEWRHVRGAPQLVPFHRHPVDVHLWRTVIEALDLAEGRLDEPWGREVGDDLGGLDELLLAALLHDIGKGWPGDHAETGAAAATAFARRAHFPPDFMVTVSDAVRTHLLLPMVATRRDIADARVVEDVANRVGRTHTLRVLYLLSVADSRATGPTVWGPWKASLMRSLFVDALAVLEARGGATPLSAARPDLRGRVLDAAAGIAEPRAISSHIDGMAPGYLRSFSAEEVVRHVRVSTSLPAHDDLTLDVREEGSVVDLLLVAMDRPGLIALVSGVLALHNLSVLGGRYFTRVDGVALQSLHVIDALGNPIAPERWRRVAADVRRALAGDLPLEQRLREKVHAYRRRHAGHRPAEVRLIQNASDAYTVVEVHASDRIGLLHDIAEALFRLQLDIHLAKIDTQGSSVVDVFYLRDLGGLPLTDGTALTTLRAALLEAVEEPQAWSRPAV